MDTPQWMQAIDEKPKITNLSIAAGITPRSEDVVVCDKHGRFCVAYWTETPSISGWKVPYDSIYEPPYFPFWIAIPALRLTR